MNSLIEQIEMWVTNLIDARIALTTPGNIQELSEESRIKELIDNHLAFSLTDNILEERVSRVIFGNSPEDVGLNMDYYLHEDSDLSCYLELDEFASKDDVHEIIERATVTISVK